MNCALTHIHPKPAKKRSHLTTPSKKSQTHLIHTHPHSPKPNQKGHNHPHPATSSHLNPDVNLWKRKFLIIHQLIKFFRNSRSPKYNFHKVRCQTFGTSIQYRTNDKSAAVIKNFTHIPFICHLSCFHFTSSQNVLFFLLPHLLLCIIFTVICTTL